MIKNKQNLIQTKPKEEKRVREEKEAKRVKKNKKEMKKKNKEYNKVKENKYIVTSNLNKNKYKQI